MSADDVAEGALRDAETHHRRIQAVLVSDDLDQRRALEVVQVHVQRVLLEETQLGAFRRFGRGNAGLGLLLELAAGTAAELAPSLRQLGLPDLLGHLAEARLAGDLGLPALVAANLPSFPARIHITNSGTTSGL